MSETFECQQGQHRQSRQQRKGLQDHPIDQQSRRDPVLNHALVRKNARRRKSTQKEGTAEEWRNLTKLTRSTADRKNKSTSTSTLTSTSRKESRRSCSAEERVDRNSLSENKIGGTSDTEERVGGTSAGEERASRTSNAEKLTSTLSLPSKKLKLDQCQAEGEIEEPS